MKSRSLRLLTAISRAISQALPRPFSSPANDVNLVSNLQKCLVASGPANTKPTAPLGLLAAVTVIMAPPLVAAQPDANRDLRNKEGESSNTAQWRVFTDMARDLVRNKKYEDAEKYLVRALEAARRGFGQRDPHVASACQNLAELYRLQKRYDEAGPLYELALSILGEEYGTKDIRLAFALHNVAGFYFGQHNYAKAAQLYEQALQVKLASVGPGHTETANTLHHLAEVRWAQGLKKKAISYETRSLDALVSQGVNEAACAKRRNRLAQMLIDDGQAAKAVCLLEEGLQKVAPGDGLERAIILELLARAHLKVGNAEEARRLLMESVELRRRLSSSWKLPDQKNMGNLAIASALCQLAESQFAFALEAKSARPAEVSAAQLSALEVAHEAVTTAERVYAFYKNVFYNKEEEDEETVSPKVFDRSMLKVTTDWLVDLVKKDSTHSAARHGVQLSQLNNSIRLDTALLEFASCLGTLAELQFSLGSPREVVEENALRAWSLVTTEWNQHTQSESSPERERSRRLLEMHKRCACRILATLSKVLLPNEKHPGGGSAKEGVDVAKEMQRYECG